MTHVIFRLDSNYGRRRYRKLIIYRMRNDSLRYLTGPRPKEKSASQAEWPLDRICKVCFNYFYSIENATSVVYYTILANDVCVLREKKKTLSPKFAVVTEILD